MFFIRNYRASGASTEIFYKIIIPSGLRADFTCGGGRTERGTFPVSVRPPPQVKSTQATFPPERSKTKFSEALPMFRLHSTFPVYDTEKK